MKIVLIGFMGSGKSSVAARLADSLQFECIECDDRIRTIAGGALISEIFEQHGEQRFRELERQVARELSAAKQAVISPGGGMIFDPANLKDLKHGESFFVYLKTSFTTLRDRIAESAGGLSNRPLLQDENKARKLYDSRLAGYEAAADIVIETDGKSVESVTSEVIEGLNKSGRHVAK